MARTNTYEITPKGHEYMEKFGSPDNTPLSEDYKRGFESALKRARECVDFQIKAHGLSWQKKDDSGTSQMGVLAAVDTAIQQEQPR